MNPRMLLSIFFICFLLPPELSFNLGSMRLSPYRIVLILSFFKLINEVLFSPDKSKQEKIVDFLILFHCSWSIISLMINEGVGKGIESGGIFFVETLGSYLLARYTIKNQKDFEYFLKIAMISCLFIFPFAFYEMVTGTHVIRESASLLTGGYFFNDIEPRMGLTRAYANFEHPILLGVFGSTLFLFFYFSKNIESKYIVPGTALFLTFSSLSSGGILAVVIQGALLIWDKVFNTFKIDNKWQKLVILMASGYLLLSLVSQSPLKLILSRITFSQQTAYFRTLIFEFGSAEVVRNPIFGIGFSDWIRPLWMPPSVDNFWLLTAMRFGLPSLLSIIAAIFIVSSQVLKNKHHKFSLIYFIVLCSLLFAGCTVHFWNQLLIYFYFFLGIGISFFTTERTELNEKV